jgi:acyl-CoA synthetase (AMP-forming)/AMP-acid ligase II/acyl carrier protein
MSAETSFSSKPSVPFSCLFHLLENHAHRIPNAPAIFAPRRAMLTYGRLFQHIDEVGRTLRTMGIGPHDRVAVVLPNGPEMAVAILSVAACAACAPMNPAYGVEELDRYLADLRPRAVITEAGTDSPARRVALSRGISIIELETVSGADAGLFTLTGQRGCAAGYARPGPKDPAFLLFTSGTTTRPKIVPLTHANVCSSAFSSVAAQALRETDRCLNVLPLFHTHGLGATLLASLAAGASVVCTPGCDVKSFFVWLSVFRPTWYSAVPTMHQAILAEARHSPCRAIDPPLRFIRSASAPLPPRVLTNLERTFEAPVIEFYGMTETAGSPIACNPLPPRSRKLGSVGVPVGLDVAIMDEAGALVPNGQMGQVVVRGPSVTLGYHDDPLATHAAFAGDWFKTGDHGFFDNDGYLFLEGRKQEIINRGGEKIAPREVDEVLVEHPAVAEAVTFAVPHDTLGEDVAAAVVLWPEAAATPRDIRQFVVGRVANFKVPREVFIVEKLPKGPSGKVLRVDLATKLGVSSLVTRPQSFIGPRTPLEKLLAERWAEILQLDRVGIHEDFFALGGDSLLVAQLIADIYQQLEIEIMASQFFDAPTIAETASYIEKLIRDDQLRRPSVIDSVPREDVLPASFAQEQLWRLQRILRGVPFLNVLYPLRLTFEVDPTILERSINEIVQRHEVLRTSFAEVDGKCVQVIAPQLSIHLTLYDLEALGGSDKKSAGHQLLQEEALRSFDLTQGPLFRARLVRLAEREYLLVITIHGIIVDGLSLGIIAEELLTLYDAFSTGASSPLAPLSFQFADFAHWQRHWQSHLQMTAQLEYWREQLREPLPVMRLAVAPPIQTMDSFRTARQDFTLSASLSEAVKLFSVQEGGTLFMTLVAALKTVLQRYLGQDDLRVATLVANRNHPGTDRLVGPLANTVILRTNLGGNPTLREVMRRVRSTTLAAFAHQDLPFEELVDTLKRERALKRLELAQVMIALHNATLRRRVNRQHGLTVEEANSDILGGLVSPTTFDLSLTLRDGSHAVTGCCIYKPYLFDATNIDRFLQDFQEVLQHMVRQPERPVSEICVSLSGKPSTNA